MTSIRPITLLDLDQAQQLAADPTLAETANLPRPYPSDGAKQWYARISKGMTEGRQVVFAVVDGTTFIGVMSLNAIDMEERSAALDYWIGHPYWGQGHATRAGLLAIAYSEHILGLSILRSSCLETNIGSRRVLEKCGFEFSSRCEYRGPFMDRFGGRSMLNCILQLAGRAHQRDAADIHSRHR